MSERLKLFAVFSTLYILAYFLRVSMAVLSADLTSEAGLTAAQLGTLSGAFFYAFAFSQIPLGPLLDRIGGRRTAIIFGLFTLSGIFIFMTAHSFYLLLAGRVLMGIGSSSVLMSALKSFTNWFESGEFGKISGYIIAIGNLGNIGGTAPFAWANTLIGWRWTFAIILLMQCTVMALLFLVRESPDCEAKRYQTGNMTEGFKEIVANPLYWRLALIAFFWYANYMAVQGVWGGPYLRDVAGFKPNEAAISLMASSIGFLFGSLFVGRFAEILKSNKRLMLLGESIMFLLMLYFLTPVSYIPKSFVPCIFFLLGVSVSSGVAIYPLIRESFPDRIVGTALTSVNLFILLGAATTQQVIGWIVERHSKVNGVYPEQSFHEAFLPSIIGLFIAIIVFASFKCKCHRKRR